ncbi:MAG: membrane dipeptidase, partial [Rhodospirillales bacterium]|nr:membrane dipeptidase [Rhodospirillales bacterium]
MSFYDLPAEMEEHAKAVHGDAFIFDGAVSVMGFHIEEETEIQAFLDGGVSGGNISLATSETDFAIAIDNISKIKRLIDRNSKTTALVVSAADLMECKRAGKFGMVIHFQNTTPILD